jgi:hypothetical protein
MPVATIHAQAGAPPRRDTAGVVRQPTQVAPRQNAQRDSAQKATAKASSTDTIPSTREIVGRVVGPKGYADAGVVGSATARAAGGDTLWSAVTLTTAPATGGRGADFKFEYPNTPKLRPARVDVSVSRQKVTKADTLWGLQFTHGKWIQAQRKGVGPAALDSMARGSTRLDMELRLDQASPVYTFLLSLPALVGLLAATIALAFVARDAESEKEKRRRKVRSALLFYAITGAITWVGIIAWFAQGFVTSDLRKISLFSPDVEIPTILPLAAFLGVLVYATECLVSVIRRPVQADGTPGVEPDYQLKLIELGNRVFIAPYVAIIAVLTIFRGATDGLAVPFVAFFTGLWIEPVLRVLKLAGDKLLPGGDSKDKPEGEPEKDKAPPRGAPVTTPNVGTPPVADSNGSALPPTPDVKGGEPVPPKR